jgi:hypothetical protein
MSAVQELDDMPTVPPALHRVLTYFAEYVLAHRLLSAQLWPSGLRAYTLAECVKLQQNAQSFSSSVTTALLLLDIFSAFYNTGTQTDLQSLLLRAKPLAELARLRRVASEAGAEVIATSSSASSSSSTSKQPKHKKLADAAVRFAVQCPRWDKHIRPCIETHYHHKHAQRQNRAYFFLFHNATTLTDHAPAPSRALVLLQYWLPGRTRPLMLIMQSAGGVYHLHDWLMIVAAVEGARATGAVNTYTIPMSTTSTHLIRKSASSIAKVATCSNDMSVRQAAYRKLHDAVRRPLLARQSDADNDQEFDALLNMFELVCMSRTWTPSAITAYKMLFGLAPPSGDRTWECGGVRVPDGVVFDSTTWTDESVAQQLARLERTLFAQANLERADRFFSKAEEPEALITQLDQVKVALM